MMKSFCILNNHQSSHVLSAAKMRRCRSCRPEVDSTFLYQKHDIGTWTVKHLKFTRSPSASGCSAAQMGSARGMRASDSHKHTLNFLLPLSTHCVCLYNIFIDLSVTHLKMQPTKQWNCRFCVLTSKPARRLINNESQSLCAQIPIIKWCKDQGRAIIIY